MRLPTTFAHREETTPLPQWSERWLQGRSCGRLEPVLSRHGWLPERAFVQSTAQVALAGIRQNNDDRLTHHIAVTGEPKSNCHRGSGGNPTQKPLLAGQAFRHLDGLFVGSEFDPIDETEIESIRDEAGADALDLVWTGFDGLPSQRLGNDGARRGLDGDRSDRTSFANTRCSERRP